MSNTLLHQHGEEFMQDLVIGSGKTFDITLYNDSTDALGDTSDLGAITTEPAGASYSRQGDAASGFTASLSSGDVQISGTTVTFDVSDSSQTVDSVAVIVNFASDLVSSDGGTSTDHLFYTNALDQDYDLGQFDSTIDLDPTKLTIN
jgi:hypothetical protein